MEIIKNNFRPIRSKKIRCKYCDSKLRVAYHDLKMTYDINLPTEYYFECPCCNKTVEFPAKYVKKILPPKRLICAFPIKRRR